MTRVEFKRQIKTYDLDDAVSHMISPGGAGEDTNTASNTTAPHRTNCQPDSGGRAQKPYLRGNIVLVWWLSCCRLGTWLVYAPATMYEVTIMSVERLRSLRLTTVLGPGQTPYFTFAESNANERNPSFSLVKLH